MIAQAGLMMFNAGVKHQMKECSITQRYRTDEVPIVWRD